MAATVKLMLAKTVISSLFRIVDLAQNPPIEPITFDDVTYQCHKIVYYKTDEKQNVIFIDQSYNCAISIDNNTYCDKYACFRLLVSDNKRYLLSCAYEETRLFEL